MLEIFLIDMMVSLIMNAAVAQRSRAVTFHPHLSIDAARMIDPLTWIVHPRHIKPRSDEHTHTHTHTHRACSKSSRVFDRKQRPFTN